MHFALKDKEVLHLLHFALCTALFIPLFSLWKSFQFWDFWSQKFFSPLGIFFLIIFFMTIYYIRLHYCFFSPASWQNPCYTRSRIIFPKVFSLSFLLFSSLLGRKKKQRRWRKKFVGLNASVYAYCKACVCILSWNSKRCRTAKHSEFQ